MRKGSPVSLGSARPLCTTPGGKCTAMPCFLIYDDNDDNDDDDDDDNDDDDDDGDDSRETKARHEQHPG